jgi:flavin-binding protein dodecin
MGNVARITQISARSSQGFDDAVRTGVERASQTLRNVSGAWVKEQKVIVQDGQITEYQVVLEITFVLED